MCPVLWKCIIGNHIDSLPKMSWPSLASPFKKLAPPLVWPRFHTRILRLIFSVSWSTNGVKIYFIYCGLICIQLNVYYQSFVMKIIAILIFLNCHVFINNFSTNMRIVSQKIINHSLNYFRISCFLIFKNDFITYWFYPFRSFKHSKNLVTHRIFNTDLIYYCDHFVIEIDEKSSHNGGF